MTDLDPVPESGQLPLPNGSTLYWTTDPSIGARHYVSDEIGGGVSVWIPALVDDSTLLAAMANEARLRLLERLHAERLAKQPSSS